MSKVVERFFLIFILLYSKIGSKEERKMIKVSKEEKRAIIQYVLEAENIGEAMDIDEFLTQVEEKERSEEIYSRSTKLRLNN